MGLRLPRSRVGDIGDETGKSVGLRTMRPARESRAHGLGAGRHTRRTRQRTVALTALDAALRARCVAGTYSRKTYVLPINAEAL